MNQLRDSSEQLIGEIRLFAFDFAPDGWLPCEGQIVPNNEENKLLFSVIGTQFGGDGQTTFGLPDLNLNSNFNLARESASPGAVPMRDKGIHYCIAVQGEREAANYFYTGQINFFPYATMFSEFENNWLPCDGRMLNIASNSSLFSRIGNKFGGDGRINFALPNLPGGGDHYGFCKYYICLGGMREKNSYLGQIDFYPYANPDPDWMACDGKMLNIASHQELFSLIGNKFGGDGESNFALPDLRGAEPLWNCGFFYIRVYGKYPTKSQ